MIPRAKLDKILERFDELQTLMSNNVDPQSFAKMSKEYAALKPVVEVVQLLTNTRKEASDLEEVLADSKSDPELVEMATSELEDVRDRLPDLEHELQALLLPKDADDDRNVIIEVRAGTGGDEAALFAGDLFRMYQRYADFMGWKVEILSASEADLGGYKEIIATVSGKGVFARLKFESGVHRVQRVPETEASGRIHTSAATVAILPEVEDVDIQIDEKDLRIDVFRASGPGGQSVNTTDSAIRVTHLPTNIVVSQQDEKSQHKNRAKAMKVLRARLYEARRKESAEERARQRRGQVGSGDRSERIRTYNFPQGRVTDHRINLTLYKLDQIIAGGRLDEIIEPLVTEDQAQRFSHIEDHKG